MAEGLLHPPEPPLVVAVQKPRPVRGRTASIKVLPDQYGHDLPGKRLGHHRLAMRLRCAFPSPSVDRGSPPPAASQHAILPTDPILPMSGDNRVWYRRPPGGCSPHRTFGPYRHASAGLAWRWPELCTRSRIRAMDFTLNGQPTTAKLRDPDMHLLDLLRDHCGITSVKDGCAQEGSCGACSVLVNGRAQVSCAMKASRVEGKEVVTQEGMSGAERALWADSFV